MPRLDPQRAIPVTLLTGFLGAGKTTLLNHLLQQPALADAAVMINEFGEVAVDHFLVEKVDDNLVVLASGCLCCSVRGELARSLRDLFMRRLRREIPVFSRVLIETTGLADPAPVLYTLLEDFFIAERFRIDGVLTVVDVTHADRQLGRHFEAVRQVAMADRLLLTKCDLATPEEIARVARRLTRANPGATQIEVRRGSIDAAQLIGCGLYDPVTRSVDVCRWLAEEKVAVAVRHGKPLGRPAEYDPVCYIHQMPGGMVSNFLAQLAQLGIQDRFEQVLEEIPAVRSDLGWAIMVTPFSQIIATQAAMNVLYGRYKVILGEVKMLLLGWYGETPSPVDANLVDRVSDGAERINARPGAVTPPALDRIRASHGDFRSDEELLLNAFFMPEALKAMYDSGPIRLDDLTAEHSLVGLVREVAKNKGITRFRWIN